MFFLKVSIDPCFISLLQTKKPPAFCLPAAHVVCSMSIGFRVFQADRFRADNTNNKRICPKH